MTKRGGLPELAQIYPGVQAKSHRKLGGAENCFGGFFREDLLPFCFGQIGIAKIEDCYVGSIVDNVST